MATAKEQLAGLEAELSIHRGNWVSAIIVLIGTTLGLVVGVGLSYVLVDALSGRGFSRYEVPSRHWS